MTDFLLRPIGERIIAIGKSQIQEMAYAELAKDSDVIISTIDADGVDGWEVISVTPPMEPNIEAMMERWGEHLYDDDIAVQAAAAGVFLVALEADEFLEANMSPAEKAMFETRDKHVRGPRWYE